MLVSWSTGEWSECSRSCNGGLRTRQVLCKRRISATEEKVLDDSACAPLRPPLTEPCSNHSCPPEWLALDWSEVGTGLLPRARHLMWIIFPCQYFPNQHLSFLPSSSHMKSHFVFLSKQRNLDICPQSVGSVESMKCATEARWRQIAVNMSLHTRVHIVTPAVHYS